MGRFAAIVLAILITLCVSGCPNSGGLTLEDLIGEDVTTILDQINNTVVIRMVNLTGQVVELDLIIDGLPQTISCPTVALDIGQDICDVALPECPIQIEAVTQRTLDSAGGFAGGRNFNGDEDFSFTLGEDFECGEFIFYRFTTESAEAFVLH